MKDSSLVDATAYPQDISYPTDVKLIHEAREKTDEIIVHLSARSSTKKDQEPIPKKQK